MKFLFFITFLVVTVSFANASVARGEGSPIEGKPNMCMAKEENMEMEFEKYYQVPSGCGRMKCDSDFGIVYHFCGSVSRKIGGKVCPNVANDKLPYPGCCPKPNCALLKPDKKM